MKRIIRAVLLTLISGTGGFCLGRQLSVRPVREVSSTHTGPTIEQIQRLAALVTTKVDIADVQVTTAQGYVGSLKVAVVVKGDLLLGVDLNQAKLERVDTKARTAVLVLPQPQVTSPRLDHERTRLFDISAHGLWMLVPGEAGRTTLINRAYADAQQLVSQAAGDPELLGRSRRQAEQVLGSFFSAAGWTVSIRWNQ